jgi:hypothetical protein
VANQKLREGVVMHENNVNKMKPWTTIATPWGWGIKHRKEKYYSKIIIGPHEIDLTSLGFQCEIYSDGIKFIPLKPEEQI